ncbi:hypothetical protein [Halorarius litoreus]|uniref:hypothetical protein n=1 Tax=Halorarius litoreus TaxID=2962676 RepID=UPI0020CB7DCB|nr:hypothetical protein [Halorarius litoreus]
MKFKVVPPAPDSLDRLEAVWKGVPIVPDAEESCCARLMQDAAVPAQDEAKEWLTFCRALGLAEEGPRGYSRVRGAFDPDALATRFTEHVYAADEALAVLADADDPLAPDAVFDRLRDRVPAWERQRSTDWTETWTERTARILAWAALFGLAAERPNGYVSV